VTAQAQTPKSPETEGRRVLVVDDDPQGLRLVGQLLMGAGYRVHAADGGRLAIRIAEQVHPDLILLDIHMPDLDGIATCRLLKQQAVTRSIPIVFLTGRDDEPSLLDAFDAGAADYVVKPFEPRILLARVRTHVALGELSRGLERALAERTRELAEANARLRRLALDLSLLDEAARARLAAELHDSPMQKLALAQIQIETADQPPDAETPERLAAGRALLREAIAELRTLQFDLSPPVLARQGLAAALAWLAESATSRRDIRLSCTIAPELPSIGHAGSVILFQCARELVYNLLKHARARHGAIHLGTLVGWLELRVEDDGVGLAPSATDLPPGPGGGYGLYSVRERLALLGGSLHLEPARLGTHLCMRVPLPVGPLPSGEDDTSGWFNRGDPGP
jgi:signal transduction histidine kinase